MINVLQCASCARFINDKAFSCEAFPEGIPEEIITGEHDHTKEFAGDKGIRFKEAKR